MTVLRYRVLNASGAPVSGRTATLKPFTGNRYRDDDPDTPGIAATSGADGWLQWTVPLVRVNRGKAYFQIHVSGEPAPVVVTVPPNAPGTVDLGQGKVGTRGAEGELVPPVSQAEVDKERNVPARLSPEGLRAAFGAVSAARPGNRVAYLGDSITQASWLTGSNFQASSFPLFAMLASGGQLITVANAGVSGDNSSQALARFDADVTPSAPGTVVILLGTNDVGQAVPLATYAANIKAIVAKVRAIGAVPVLGTIPPNNTVGRHMAISTLNAWLRRYAGRQGIPVLNFYSLLVDPATGGIAAAYNGDGTHPNVAGYLAMGNLVASTLTPLVPPGRPYTSLNNADPLNALSATNSILLTDTNADGVPDGWFAYGGSTGYAHALVTDSAVPGKLAQITQTANTSIRAIQKGVSGASVGDRLAVSGVVTSDGGVKAQVKLTFTGPNSAGQAANFAAVVTRGFYYQEVVVPAGTTGVVLDLIADVGTGVVAFGQPTVVNLTSSGIATL